MFIVPCFEPKMQMNNKQKLNSEEDKENKLVVGHETHQANIYESTVWEWVWCIELYGNAVSCVGIVSNISGVPWTKDQY